MHTPNTPSTVDNCCTLVFENKVVEIKQHDFCVVVLTPVALILFVYDDDVHRVEVI